ncbi:MAG: hypothetical protein RR838_03555 [Clostridium sp.]
MEGSLKGYLNEYLSLTIKVNQVLEGNIEDDMDSLDSLLLRREEVSKKIEELNYTKEEFKLIIDELGLIEENQKMGNLLGKHLESTQNEIDSNKKEMTNIAKQRMVSNKYINYNPIDPVFLSRKY